MAFSIHSVRLRPWVLACIFLSFLLLLSAGYVANLQIDALAETERWVSHTHEVRKNLFELLANLDDASAAGRGYLLTGESSYLIGERANIVKARKCFETLRALTADNPTQQAALDVLGPVIAHRIAQMEERLEPTRKTTTGSSSEDLVEVAKGRALVDQIHKLCEEMDLREAILLVQREDAARNATNRTKAIAAGGGGIGFLLLAVTLFQLLSENSARRRSEIALKEGEEWLHTITDNMPALIGYIDANQCYRFNNRTYESWHGLTPKQLQGMSLREFMGEEAYSLIKPNIEKCLTGKRVTFERELTELKAGRFAQVTYIPHFDGNLGVIGAFVLVIDITKRKRAEADAEEARKVAEAANRAKSEFLANMSHEIRTPMNGVLGMVELICRSKLTEQQQLQMGMIKLSADSLLEIIDQILDVSKIEAGKLELDAHPFSLRDGFEIAMTLMASRANLKNIELAYHIPSEVPDCLVGDATRLNQIVINLVGNAIKFTEHGEVFVRVAVETQSEHDVCLHISVKDSGIGIPPEKQKAVFEPFTQADSSTTRMFGGTGLGLTICKELVAMMNGKIWVESVPGQGSTFHFMIRLAISEEPVVNRFSRCRTDLSGLSVLVVDDSATNCFAMNEMLLNWKMKPTVVNDGAAALAELLRAHEAGNPYRLVLADANMPGMDGFTLARRIKDDTDLSGTSVTILSSGQVGDDVDHCRNTGVPILPKPVGPSTLMDSIATAVNAMAVNTKSDDQPTIKSDVVRRLHILLAEDNAINQAVAEGILEHMGHSVAIASNGMEAVDLYARERFDLVFMDIQMPEMDGFGATARIRNLQKENQRMVPIVAMTAHAMKGDRERCLAADMDDYISKPVNSRELLRIMIRLNLIPGDSTGSKPSPSPANRSVRIPYRFRKAELVENFKDGEDLLASIAAVFAEHAPKWMSDIQEAISRQDAKKVQASAHTLKGSVSNFVQSGPFELAYQLEQMGRAGDLSGAELIFSDLREDVASLCETLNEFGKLELT